MKKSLLILLLLPVFCLAEPRLRPQNWATPVINTHLHNLYAVNDQIYRSEQPDDEDVTDLKQLGIREILNLREFHQDDDDLPATDFTLHRIKMKTSQISEDEIVNALRLIKNRQGPILIHCWHGSDRTGVVIASYRMVFDGWSKAQAIDEMVNGGYGYHARVYPELIELIENLDFEEVSAQVNTPITPASTL